MKNVFVSILVVSMIVLTGCEVDLKLNPDGFTEFTADINSRWKIDQITQNDNDITDVLLMYAEVLNEIEQRSSAISLDAINQMRAKA